MVEHRHSKNRAANPAKNRRDNLRECVERAMHRYFQDLDGHKTTQLYKMFMAEVEQPFLRAIMRKCKGNLSEAARMLGIHRGTLRKRLKQHGIENY